MIRFIYMYSIITSYFIIVKPIDYGETHWFVNRILLNCSASIDKLP